MNQGSSGPSRAVRPFELVAGVEMQHQPGLEDISTEQWDHTFKTNITGEVLTLLGGDTTAG